MCECLFGFRKLYETVQLRTLSRDAAQLKYPPGLLAIAYQMYLAPRLVIKNAQASLWCYPTKGIVPGCGQAMHLARVALYKPMQPMKATAQHRSEQYVDDINVAAVGTKTQLQTSVPNELLGLARRLRAHGMVLSKTKNTLVASSADMGKCIVDQLVEQGLPIGVKGFARDLGITAAAGRRRRLVMEKVGASSIT